MRTQTPRAPEAITFERDYRGTIDQARHVRADLAKVAAALPGRGRPGLCWRPNWRLTPSCTAGPATPTGRSPCGQRSTPVTTHGLR